MAEDVKEAASSSKAEESEQETELKSTEEDTEKSEDGKPESRRDKRIQQLIQERDEARQLAVDFRKHALDPNDRVEFENWKKAKLAKAEEAEEAGDITPAKLAAIRKLMRQADPEYRKLLEDRETEQRTKEEEAKAKMEAQFDDAEEQIRDYCKDEFGFGEKHVDKISFFAKQVMLAISDDPKLSRKWNLGDLSCIPKGCKIVREHYNEITKSTNGKRNDIADKRRISRLPGLPGGSGVTSGAPARSKDDRGLTKQASDDAWAVFQAHMQE